MALFLHGLAEGAAPQHAPPHDPVATGGLWALTSPAPQSDTAEALADLALRHNDILSAWAARGPVLPLRFGTVFSGPAALQDHLAREWPRLTRALQALGDSQEFVLRLRVLGDPVLAPEPSPATGRAFLARGRAARDLRRDLADRRLSLARELLSAATSLARQVTPAAAPRADRILDAAVLLPRPKGPELAVLAAQHRAAATALGLDLALTGPWPAYGFTPPETADVR